jgi:hypothetical protein
MGIIWHNMDEVENGPKIKKGLVHFKPGAQMQFDPQEGISTTNLTEIQDKLVKTIVSSIKAYVETAKGLLKGKYSHIKDFAPIHLTNPSAIACICCPDGIIIRYDAKGAGPDSKTRIISGWSDETITQMVPKISENIIFCYSDKNDPSLIPQLAPEIRLAITDEKTNQQERVIFHGRIGLEVVIKKPPNTNVLINVAFIALFHMKELASIVLNS